MFEAVKLAVALGGSTACALYDLKTSDMLDVLAIGMIIFGLGIHAYESYILGDPLPFLLSAGTGLLFLAFGLLMYYTGSWGGGDGELLVAIGVLLPVGFLTPLFTPLFFLNVFLVGGIYSLVYSAVITRNNSRVWREFRASVVRNRKKDLFAASAFLAAFGLASLVLESPLFLAAGLLLAVSPFALRFARAVEAYGFYRRIPVSRLRKGDVIGEDVPEAGVFKKYIRGLTEEEVSRLKRVRKFVTVRDGVRYGPVFPLALLLTLLL